VALGETTNQMQLKLQFVRTYADTGLAYRLAGKTKRNTLSVVKATYMVPLAR
jgi:4-hydroxy-L-threonine phosphate dehydrogenase PdxA